MYVSNLTSPNGNKVANQFKIVDDEGNVFFQSYQAIICKKTRDGKTYLDSRFWDYSTTTGKYRNIFLGEDKKTTQKKITSGEYILTDLNVF